MTERYDALAVRKDKKSGKSYFTKIGAAFPTQNGGWLVSLDCIPGPDPETGQFKLLLAVPKPREDRGGQGPAPATSDFDSEIPFAPEVR